MPKFVMIIGPQAVGKMTVGQELSKLTGYKLFYNHMTIEMTKDIFDYDKETFWRMNRIIRNQVFEEFAKSNENGIIFTGCFDFSVNKLENENLENYPFLTDECIVVELEASLEERLARNKTENRLNLKPSKRNIEWSEKNLLKAYKNQRLNSIEDEGKNIFKKYIKINNTNISAEETARIIKEKFNL